MRDNVAVLHDRPVHVAETSDLAEAIVAVGDFATGPSSPEKNYRCLETMATLADSVGRVRMLGSGATDLAWLAAGRVDAVVMHGNNAWDRGAGIALARFRWRYGHLAGAPYSLSSSDLLATASGVHAALLSVVNGDAREGIGEIRTGSQ